jgi:hypothetical protein
MQKEIHGAYEADEDRWIIARWELDGHFYPLNDKGKQPITSVDLINEDEEEIIPIRPAA